jgi:hypothetical protein
MEKFIALTAVAAILIFAGTYAVSVRKPDRDARSAPAIC